MSIISFCLKTHPSFRVPTIVNLNQSLELAAAGYTQESIQKKFTEPLSIFWMVSYLLKNYNVLSTNWSLTLKNEVWLKSEKNVLF